jgi:two-component system sensor histidine kinase AlgZ
MHPFLASRGRLGLYLVESVPVTSALLFLLARNGLAWKEAWALSVPLIVIYLFVCLAPWYLCRVLPLSTQTIRLFTSHFAAAVVAAGAWAGIAKGIAMALSGLFPGLGKRIDASLLMIFGVGVTLYLLAVALSYLVLTLEASRESEAREREARFLAREAELYALRAQINPHFLFNSLNSISALCSVDPILARDMCIRLSDFLRSTLALGEKPMIPFSQELALANSYLGVEKIRFGSRLAIARDISPECADCMVPPLILQPLIENAIKHGVSAMIDGGTVTLRAEKEREFLRVAVENEFDIDTPPRQGQGIGLKNVRGRLAARFGDEARFYTKSDSGLFSVEMLLPCERSQDA